MLVETHAQKLLFALNWPLQGFARWNGLTVHAQ